MSQAFLDELRAKGLDIGTNAILHSESSVVFSELDVVKTIITPDAFRAIFGGQNYNNITLLPDEGAVIGNIKEIKLTGVRLSPASWRISYTDPENAEPPVLNSFHIEPSKIIRFINE